MKLDYDHQTDSLYIDLSTAPGADSQEIADGVVVDFEASGKIVGVDIQHASERVDISEISSNLITKAA